MRLGRQVIQQEADSRVDWLGRDQVVIIENQGKIAGDFGEIV